MGDMALSISTSFNYDLPIETQLPLIAEAGFSHVSLGEQETHSGLQSEVNRRKLKSLLRQYSLQIDTIHGPRADQPDSLNALSNAARAAADLSARVVVTHGSPFDFSSSESSVRLNRLIQTCEALDSIAADTGVVFALENVLPGPATDLVSQVLPFLNSRHFGFCYDSAHDQIGGPRPFDLLARLADRVVAVHLSDRIADFVDHVVPGEGFIDWEGLARALRRTHFSGPLLLETMVVHSAEKDPRRFLQLAYERGCWLWRLMGEV